MATTPLWFPSKVGEFDSTELLYPWFVSPFEAFRIAKKRDKVGDGSFGQEWVYYLRMLSIMISESRVYLTIKGYCSIALELGIFLKPSAVWIIISLVVFSPIALSNSIEVRIRSHFVHIMFEAD